MPLTQEERLIKSGYLPKDFSQNILNSNIEKDADTYGSARIKGLDALESTHGNSGIPEQNKESILFNKQNNLKYGDEGYKPLLQATSGDRANLDASLMSFKNIESGPSILRGQDVAYSSFNDTEQAPVAKTTGDDFFTRPIEQREFDKYGRELYSNPEYAEEMVRQGLAVPYETANKANALVDAKNAKINKLGAWKYAETEMNEKFALRNNNTTVDGNKVGEFSAENALKGFTSGALTVGAKVGSAVGEILQSFGGLDKDSLDREQRRLDREFPGEKVPDWRKEVAKGMVDIGTNMQKMYTEFQTTGMADDITKYDSYNLDQLTKEIGADVDKGDYLKAIGKAVTDVRTVEVIVNSLPEMAALAVSTGGMALANANNNINIGESKLNRDFTPEEKAQSFSVSIVSTYLDRFGDKLALSGMNPAKVGLKRAISNLDAPTKDMLASTYGKAILKLSEAPLRLIGAGAVEGVTETAQTFGETAAQNPDVFDKGFTDEQVREAKIAGVLGAASGAHLATPKVAADVLTDSNTYKSIGDVATLGYEGAKNTINAVDNFVNKTGNSEAVPDSTTTEVDKELSELTAVADDEAPANILKRMQTIGHRVGAFPTGSPEHTKWVGELSRVNEIFKSRVDEYKAKIDAGLVDDVKNELGSSEEAFDMLSNSFTNEDEIVNYGNKLGVSTESITKATDVFKALKSISEVEDEVTEGKRGYKSYYEQMKAGKMFGDDQMYNDASSKLASFSDSQNTKANTIERVAETILDTMIQEGTLEAHASKSAKDSKHSKASWGTGSIEVNWSDVAKRELNGNVVGALKVAQKVRESVDAMNVLRDSVGPLRDTTRAKVQQEVQTPVESVVTSEEAPSTTTVDVNVQPTKVESTSDAKLKEVAVNEVSVTPKKTIDTDKRQKSFLDRIIAKSDGDLKSALSTLKESTKSVTDKDKVNSMVDYIKTNLTEKEITPEKTVTSSIEPVLEEGPPDSIYDEDVSESDETMFEVDDVTTTDVKPDKPLDQNSEEAIKAKVAKLDILIYKYVKSIDNIKTRNKVISGRIKAHKGEIRRLRARISSAVDKSKERNVNGYMIVAKIIRAVKESIIKFKAMIEKHNKAIDNYDEVLVDNGFKIENRLEALAVLRAEKKELEQKLVGNDSVLATIKNSISGRTNSIVKLKTDKAGQETSIGKIVGPAKASTKLSSIDLRVSEISPAVRQFTVKSIKAVRKVIAPAKLDENGKITNAEYLALKDSLGRGLLYDKDGKMNANTAVAITLAATDYIAYSGMDTLVKTREDVARVLGIQELDVTDDQMRLLANAGTLKKLVATDIGAKVMSNLGIKGLKNISEETIAKLRADLGQMSLAYLEGEGLIIPLRDISVNIPTADFLAVTKGTNETASVNTGATVPFVKLSPLGEKMVIGLRINADNISDDLAIERSANRPRFYKNSSNKSFTVKNNDVMTVPKKSEKLLNKLENDEYSVNIKGVKLLKKIGVDKVKSLMGFKSDEELSKLSFLDRESQIARNREISKSVDELIALDAEVAGKRNSFYFNWFFSRNGRFMISSNTVNPQTDKLHRFLASLSSHTVIVDLTNADESKVFKLSIAQAFGFDIDKMNEKESLEFATKVLETQPSELYKIFEDGKLTLDDGTVLKAKEIGHTIQAFEAIKDYRARKGDTFKTTISLELDAVTSGFIIKLMQLPIISDVHKWLSKGGVFTNEYGNFSNISGTNDEFDGGLVDSYRTLASSIKLPDNVKDVHGIWSEFKELLPVIIRDEKVTSEGRALFKQPFMVFNYGAQLVSIKAALAKDMLEAIPASMLTTENGRAFASELNKKLGLNITPNMIRTTDIMKLQLKDGSTLGEYLSDILESTYGKEVETVLLSHFSPIVEANKVINRAFSYMFRAYNVRYTNRVEEFKRVNGRDPSVEDKIEIIHSLRDVFPAIKAPFSEGLADSVAINDSKLSTRKDLMYTQTQTHLADGTTIKVESLLREFEESIAGGGVIPIHYIDGSMISDALIDSDALGVHDAIVVSVKDAMKANTTYNNSMYDTNKNYSLVEQLAISMNRVASLLTPDEIDSIKLDVVGKGMPIKFSAVVANVNTLNDDVKIARESLFSNEMKIDHMTGLGAVVSRGNELDKQVNTKTYNGIMQVMKKFKDCKNGM